MRRVRIEEPAAIGAEHLDGFLRRHRALRNGLHRPFERRDFGIRVKVLDHSLRAQQQSRCDGNRQQDVYRAAYEIDPEVADRLRRMPREPADHRDRHHDSRGRREEVVRGQADHLREIAHGGLGRIRLPVRIRCETHRRVERKVRSHVSEALRIQRQPLLNTLQQIRDQQRYQAENQQRSGISRPVLLGRFIDAAQTVDPCFEGPQHPVQPRALPLEHLHHEDAHWLGQRQDYQRIQRDLQNAIGCHRRLSEPLRTEQRIEQIHSQKQRNDQ